MRVVLTRPSAEGAGWSGELARHGHQALLLPLIDIAPAPDPHAVLAARDRLAAYQAAMFVSANAVRQFLGDGADAAWPGATQAWATGPGTAQALHQAGVPRAQVVAPAEDAARFDSEALWDRAAAAVQPGWRVLVVRGAGADGAPAGRDWLTLRLQAAGARVDQVAAYVRRLPLWSDEQRAAAVAAAADGSVWLFSSSEAVANLRRLLPAQDWSRTRALATHERIALAAREAGFAVTCVRPGVDALVRALESPR